MKILKKLAKTYLALLPIVAIVLFVHLFFYRFDSIVLLKFLLAVLVVGIGETCLFSGIDSTIMPMGELMVQSVNKASRFVIFIIFAVSFGAFATAAEPDVAIFSSNVIGVGVNISKPLLIFLIGAGVGVFVAFAIIRIVRATNIKFIYLAVFAIIFLIAAQVPSDFVALAFDAGGATTGLITAPFLLAIATGISNKFSKKDNKEIFGMIGIASLGPVILTLIVFLILNKKGVPVSEITEGNVSIYLSILKQATLSIVPLTLIFFVYDLCFIKLPSNKKLSLLLGMCLTFVGLYMFLFGIEFGVSNMAKQVGLFIETLSVPMVIIVCVIIGFVITFCEPSIVVLAKQVESATKGNISKTAVLIAIAISMALAVLISALKIIFNINFLIVILACYTIAIVLMFFVPSMFTGLAFDSGGAASGPMTSAFLLPIMIQFASSSSSMLNGFGIIGIVAVSPIIVVQTLGFVYKVETDKQDAFERRRAVKVSYTADMYSNIQKLENEYKILIRKRDSEK